MASATSSAKKQKQPLPTTEAIDIHEKRISKNVMSMKFMQKKSEGGIGSDEGKRSAVDDTAGAFKTGTAAKYIVKREEKNWTAELNGRYSFNGFNPRQHFNWLAHTHTFTFTHTLEAWKHWPREIKSSSNPRQKPPQMPIPIMREWRGPK